MKQKTRILIYILIAIAVVTLGSMAILTNHNASNPMSAQEKIDLGHAYLLDLSYEKAALEFTEAIEIDPMNADAYLGLAEAYQGMGDIEKAIEALETGYEKTGDQRLKDKLDELSPPEETTVTTTVPTTVTTTETTTTIELVTVPDLAGMTQEEALSACEELGISCDVKTEESDTVEKDHVISQSVLAGANVPINYAISVTVSEGKKPETTTETVTTITQSTTLEYDYSHDTLIPFYIPSEITIFYNDEQRTKYGLPIDISCNGDYNIQISDFDVDENNIKKLIVKLLELEPVHIKIASKIIANVRFPKYITSSLS